ncbi:ABC transporter substrate-binding protein [Mesorhizobium sp. M0208]|uniref:ABC transporter substrate-binding protein n=1 Tax=Mesorhizobium sp. M0208 TaxID=2956916 RepID=UPI0033387582
MWEPLFILDYSSGALEPWLGLSLAPDAAQKVWTLKLREGVEWSDGTPLTSEDVRFTAQMVIDHRDQFPAFEASTFASQVAVVAATDSQTVTFTLLQPNPRFGLENFGAGLFSSFLIMPKSKWQKAVQDDASGKRPLAAFTFSPPMGTGPYILDDPQPKEDPFTADPLDPTNPAKHAKVDPTKQIFWTLNPRWWGAKPGPDAKLGPDGKPDPNAKPVFRALPAPLHLEWKFVGREQDSVNQIVANHIDAADEYSPGGLANAKSQNAAVVGWDSSPSPAWNEPCPRQLEINTQAQPWSDPELRRALSLLIDRSDLAHTAYGDTAAASTTMFAQYGAMDRFIDPIQAAGLGLPAKADEAAADQILTSAGYQKDADGLFKKSGKALTATIVVDEVGAKDVDGANAVATQLRSGGVDAKVSAISNDDYWGDVIPNGRYELAYGSLSCGSVAEPYASMSRYTSDKYADIGSRSPGFGNTGRWNTDEAKKYSAIVEDLGKRPLDDPAIPQLVVQAYAFIAHDVPFIPLVQSPKIFAFNTTYWTGWPTAQACLPSAPPAQGSAAPVKPAPKGGKAPGNEVAHAKCTVPMHSWAATERLLFQLKRAGAAAQ